MRLDKYLTLQGLLTRSQAKDAIKCKRVKVNNKVILKSDYDVKDNDEVTYNGEKIENEKYVYYVLNKPKGYVCAKKDNLSKVVLELIDDKRKDLSIVGRLDKDTTGLLIITNDGELNHKITSPKSNINKTYYAEISGIVTKEDVKNFKEGLDIGDSKKTKPSILKILKVNEKENISEIEVTISEGRYHEVKRMFEACNKKVINLKRLSIGKLKLDKNIKEGKYIKINYEELKKLIFD